MKKTVYTRISLALIISAFVLSAAGCDIDVNVDENVNVGNSTSAVSESTDVSEKKDAASETKADKKTANEETKAENKTKEPAETEAKNEDDADTAEITEEVTEENKEDAEPEVKEDTTEVVTEDGIRYSRIGTSSVYSDDEVARLNEDMKKVQHDAVERFGNWQTSSTEEQQKDGVSSVTAELMTSDNHLKNIWKVDVGNTEGCAYYDSRTLELLTVKKLFGENWAENNNGTSEGAEWDDHELLCTISFNLDEENDLKLRITANAPKHGLNVSVLRENINPDFIGDTNPVPGK